MAVNEAINYIKEYMDTLECREMLGPHRDVFVRVVYELERQFIFMEKSDEKPKTENALVSDIISSLEFLQAIYMELPITHGLNNFVSNYCILVYNWNNNVACNEKISLLSQLVDRIYKNHMTTMECFEAFKILIQRCRRLEAVSLPSVELSKHYLQALDREVEKK